MSITSEEELRQAVQRLHRTKDAAYRDAWKKRGEVMSIMANIARKVDRLEYAVAGAPAAADESLLDTAVDLLIYTLKYQTYLADQDDAIARKLFGGSLVTPPYSEATGGFDVVLARLDMTPVAESLGPDVTVAASRVIGAFTELEACFQEVLALIVERAARAVALANASVVFIGSLARQAPERYRDFLVTYTGEVDQCAPRTTPSSPEI
jgi:hypothetical protein